MSVEMASERLQAWSLVQLLGFLCSALFSMKFHAALCSGASLAIN
jgi:hypothetical protein